MTIRREAPLDGKHVPVSFSVSSNVPGFTTESCTVVPDLDLLVAALVANLSEIQINAYELAKDKWRDVFENLEKLYQEAIEEEGEAMDDVEECHTDKSDDDKTKEEQEANDQEDSIGIQFCTLQVETGSTPRTTHANPLFHREMQQQLYVHLSRRSEVSGHFQVPVSRNELRCLPTKLPLRAKERTHVVRMV